MNNVIALNKKEVVLVSGGEKKRLCQIPEITTDGKPGYGTRDCSDKIAVTDVVGGLVLTALIFFGVGAVFLGCCNAKCRAAAGRFDEVVKKKNARKQK